MTSADGDDVLSRAKGALRDEQDAALARARRPEDRGAPAGDPTWILIVGDIRRARRRRRLLWAVALQVLVLLAGTGVWAAVTGRLAALAEWPGSLFASRKEPPAPRAESRPRAGARPPAPVAEPTQAAARADDPAGQPPAFVTAPPPSPAHRAAPEIARAARRRIASAQLTPADFVAPQSAAPAASGAMALYRAAHQLHFVDRDFAAALAAWDRYLAAGAGPLAIEARYNRAIALAHLGRAAEAVAALRPFADGAQGGYRQDEARALIARLEAP